MDATTNTELLDGYSDHSKESCSNITKTFVCHIIAHSDHPALSQWDAKYVLNPLVGTCFADGPAWRQEMEKSIRWH